VPLSGALLFGRFLALSANTSLGREGQPLELIENIRKLQTSFITLGPGANVI
jgi:hypothetical protein